ncbi:FAD-dependent oxidoreductase [Streptomyces sp. NPDC018045]|uniref:FAD-dependent oxidoreductase n=1 Tax=Streptomyces sp. NPDC018045 TaxID=3365037 RepID=UPI00379CB097
MIHPHWPALREALSGRVVLPQDVDYDVARALQIADFDRVRPQAVVYCASEDDVRQAVGFARGYGLEVHVRGGGHSLAGFSTGTGMVIDVTGIAHVVVEDGLVRVGAGTQTVDLHDALRGSGLTLPSGLCPTVGVAGLTLGGGVGPWTRAYGVTSDRLRAARVVLADGRVVACDEHRESELFWALRGAGPGFFGVVTELTFDPVPAGDITTFLLTWPWAQAARVLDAWQRWAPHAPDELASSLRIALEDAAPGQEAAVCVSGTWLGPTSPRLQAELDQLVARVGAEPANSVVFTKSHWETMLFFFGCEDLTVAQAHREGTGPQAALPRDGFVLTRGHFVTDPIPPEGIADLLAAFDSHRQTGRLRSLEFGAMGGACNRVAPDATAFVHRDTLFFGGFSAEDTADLDEDARHSAQHWTDTCRSTLRPYASAHSYQNSPDTQLTNWRTAYYGDNHPRLAQARQTYDPDRFFQGARSI